MPSFTEILTIVAIIFGIIFLPKMFRPEQKGSTKKLTINSIPVLARFGIIASILVPIISALYFQPMKDGLIMFILTGIIPLIVGWGIYWMVAGLKKKSKTK